MAKVSEQLRALEARTAHLELLCAHLFERLKMAGDALVRSEVADVSKPAGANDSGVREKAPACKGQVGAGARSAVRQTPQKVSAVAYDGVAVARKPTKTRPDTAKAAPKKLMSLQQTWFKKGEAIQLFRRILKQPMPSRQLMTGVIRAKRKSELPKPDLERFRWAVQAALKQAVKRSSIVRQKDGLLAATAVEILGEPATIAAGER